MRNSKPSKQSMLDLKKNNSNKKEGHLMIREFDLSSEGLGLKSQDC